MWLIVDDDPAVAETVRRHVARRGHAAVVATSVADARLVGTGRHLDAAILDQRLPDGDGLAVFSELRRHWPALVGVMLTAFGSVPSAVASLRAGMSDYVEKPADIARLIVQIETLIAAAAAREGDPRPGAVTSALAVRIAQLIARGLGNPMPPRTLDEWGRQVGVAPSTLRAWFRILGVQPRNALSLVRGVWVLEHSPNLGVRPAELLGYLDPRSIRRFAERGGFSVDSWHTLTSVQFCLHQQFCPHKPLVAELIRLLLERDSGRS